MSELMETNPRSADFTLELDRRERAELMTLLERELRDTHVEARRTESPRFQQVVHDQESVLHSVLEKLRGS
jgi:hypothetical protein